MSTPTKEDLAKRKQAALDEIERQKLEAEVKALEKQTKRPPLIVGVARVYVKGAKAAFNLLGQGIDELNKATDNSKPAKPAKKGKKNGS